MNNNILSVQNEPQALDLLKAQRVAYSHAKRYQILDWIQYIFAFLIPVIFLFLKITIKTESDMTNVIGILAAFTTILSAVVYYVHKQTTKEGAILQEKFDVKVFDIPWNEVLIPNKDYREKIHALAGEYKDDDLKNWYSIRIVKEINPNIAVLLCQYSNILWDMRLRKKFANLILNLLVGYYAFFLIIGLVLSFSFLDILVILTPSFSSLLFTVVSLINQYEAITDKEEALDLTKSLFKTYKETRRIPDKQTLRGIQDKIFALRCQIEKTPDAYYQKYKESTEKQLDEIISNMIEEYELKQ